jgi:hypothetical protein
MEQHPLSADMARPSEYRQEMVELGRNYCLLGATDDDMARFFDVDVRSIHRWKLDHPEFAQALREGKEEADAKVARRLYERATGYSPFFIRSSARMRAAPSRS